MDKLRDIAFMISGESYSIMNAKLPNLSVNYALCINCRSILKRVMEI